MLPCRAVETRLSLTDSSTLEKGSILGINSGEVEAVMVAARYDEGRPGKMLLVT